MRLALAIAALLACMAQAQTMYKWVDEKGVTHFSETPPPDGKGQKVDVKPTAPSSGSAPASDNWRQRDLDARRSRVEREQLEQVRAREKAQDSAERKRRCDHARQQLRVLETQVPVFQLDEKKERVFATDEVRAREIAAYKRTVAENCE